MANVLPLGGEEHPLPIFATNISGREDKARFWMTSPFSRAGLSSALRLWEAPVTVIGAQFMYISRSPILLNQVQARV